MANPFKKLVEEVVEPAFDFASDLVEDIGDFATEVVGEVISWFYKPDIPDINRDILVNKQSNIAPIPVIYGRRRIGGTRVAVGLSDDKKDLYVVLAMCEGEIQQIESIYIDDVISTDARFTGKVTINQYLGTDSQTADSMLTAAFPSLWTSNHRLRGIAYLACKFVYDPEVFRSIPTITAVVKGRKVYDPRSSTTAYSDNPALCLLDYLTNSRYGKGLSLTDIDTQSFEDAADDCDLAVTKYTGAPANTEIFRCNAVIDTGQTIFENVKIILSGMRGLLPYQNGKYGLKIEQDSSSVMSFNTENMLNGVSFSVLGKDKRYNKVTAKFVNPDANWQVDSVVWPESGSSEETTFLTEDDNVELSTEITLPTCTDFYAARDLARLVCLVSRKNNLVVSFAATADALKVQAGDIIDFTYDSANLSAQKFRVQEISLSSNGVVQIGAQKHDATIYPWATYAIYDSLGDLGEVTQYQVIDPPTNLSLSSSIVTQESNEQFVKVILSWDASDQYNLLHYEVQWKKSSDTDYQSTTTTDTSLEGGGVEANTSYDVRVRTVTIDGAYSTFLTGTFTTATGMVNKLREGDAAADVNSNSTTILGTKITDNSITTNKLVANFIEVGDAASDINSNATTISGGKITTGTISADRIQSNTTVTANSTTFGLGTATSFESTQSGGQFISSSSSYYGLIVANTNTSGSALAAGTYSTNSDNWAIVAGSGANSSFTTFSNVAGLCDGNKAGLFADISGYSGSTPSFNSQIWLGYGTAAAYLWAGSYQPFTGSHDGLYDNTVSLPDLGDILVDTSVVTKKDINNTLTKVSRSSSPNQKTVIGVYSGSKDSSKPIAGLSEPVSLESGGTTMQTEAQYQSLLDDYDPISINALGEGLINVCNEGGNIEAGDLIVTSSMAGKGMKQSDDIVRSYTVAKARESATFASNTEVKQGACIYLCG